jgi:hypothetical protein
VISYLELRAACMSWLRYDKGCPIVVFERGPWAHLGHRPDVMAVTKKRELVEVEIKRTFADFKQDVEKRIWQSRDLFKRGWPSFFHFLVTPDLVTRAEPLLRDGFGLVTIDPAQSTFSGLPAIVSVKRATRQKDARDLTTRQLVEMVSHQSGSLISSELGRLRQETDERKTVNT